MLKFLWRVNQDAAFVPNQSLTVSTWTNLILFFLSPPTAITTKFFFVWIYVVSPTLGPEKEIPPPNHLFQDTHYDVVLKATGTPLLLLFSPPYARIHYYCILWGGSGGRESEFTLHCFGQSKPDLESLSIHSYRAHQLPVVCPRLILNALLHWWFLALLLLISYNQLNSVVLFFSSVKSTSGFSSRKNDAGRQDNWFGTDLIAVLSSYPSSSSR